MKQPKLSDPNGFLIQVAVREANGMCVKSFFSQDGQWFFQIDVAPPDGGPQMYVCTSELGSPAAAALEAIASVMDAFSCVVKQDELPGIRYTPAGKPDEKHSN